MFISLEEGTIPDWCIAAQSDLQLLLPHSGIILIVKERELSDCYGRQFAFRSTELMHDLVIELFINRYKFGLSI